MTTVSFEKLLDNVSSDDKKELGLAHNGRIGAMKAYQEHPGKETKSNLDAARAYYEETLDRLALIYFPGERPAPEGERFKNKKEAFSWITANHGNVVSQGKFYQDSGNGFPLAFPDKSVSKFSVLEYVLKLKNKNGSAPSADSADFSGRKEKAETEKAEFDARSARVRAEEAERERDARWMLREDSEDQEAALVGLIKDTFRHRVYLDHTELLRASGGTPARDAEFAHALQGFVNRAFNDVANYKEIDIMFDVEADDDL